MPANEVIRCEIQQKPHFFSKIFKTSAAISRRLMLPLYRKLKMEVTMAKKTQQTKSDIAFEERMANNVQSEVSATAMFGILAFGFATQSARC